MTKIVRHTERPSNYNDIDKMSSSEILKYINQEDQKVANSVKSCIDQIEAFVNAAMPSFKRGGRVIYIGAGTSGRLGIVDASEIPPTFGMEFDRFIGIIAGGDGAIRKAVEFAEDSTQIVIDDLRAINLGSDDCILGLAASGTTPYVIAGMNYAKSITCITGCITCNENTPLAASVDYPIEAIVGPEFITGSTRMKSGSAQKMILNMISTSIMIKYGRVKGNKMINMQLTNNKLVNRGEQMLIDELDIDKELASTLLKKYKSVDQAIKAYQSDKT